MEDNFQRLFQIKRNYDPLCYLCTIHQGRVIAMPDYVASGLLKIFTWKARLGQLPLKLLLRKLGDKVIRGLKAS